MASPGSASPAALDPPSSVPSPASAVAAFINKVWSILGNEDYKHLISWSEVSNAHSGEKVGVNWNIYPLLAVREERDSA